MVKKDIGVVQRTLLNVVNKNVETGLGTRISQGEHTERKAFEVVFLTIIVMYVTHNYTTMSYNVEF